MDKREKRQEVKFICGECGKEFSPKKGKTYGRYEGNEFKFVCDQCYDKWVNRWETAEIEIVDTKNTLYHVAKVKFSDSETAINWMYEGNTAQIVDMDTPESFNNRLHEEAKKFYDELNKRKVANVKFVEEFDNNKLVITYGSGEQKELRWKYSRNGSLFIDPAAATELKLDSEAITEIHTQFKAWNDSIEYQANKKPLSAPLDRTSDFLGIANKREFQKDKIEIINYK